MAEENGRNRRKQDAKKIVRLRLLSGIDLCACCGGHKLTCHGVCRSSHTDPATGAILCHERYRIQDFVEDEGGRKPRRNWKHGRQNTDEENQSTKDRRREKRARTIYDGV